MPVSRPVYSEPDHMIHNECVEKQCNSASVVVKMSKGGLVECTSFVYF